jgi:hypothetical protein
MNIDRVANESLRLDPKSRAILAETIWDSLEEPFLVSSDVTDEESISLAMKRDEEIENGLFTAISQYSPSTPTAFLCAALPRHGTPAHRSISPQIASPS